MTLKKDTYTANEILKGFYDSYIKKGTILYPFNKTDKPIKQKGKSCNRFVFDTIKGSKAHDYPKGNIRISIWATNGKFDENIS